MYWPVGAPKCFAEHTLPTYGPPPSREVPEDEKTINHGTVAGLEARHEANSAARSEDERLISIRVSRSAQLFATLTRITLSIWQTQPPAVLATVVRSAKSLKAYGDNIGLLLRPDADTIVIQTTLGYLITYSVIFQPEHQANAWSFQDGDRKQARRRSTEQGFIPQEQNSLLHRGILTPLAILRFRMVIKLDAGISKALALDHELIIATRKPAAIQCIRWTPDRDNAQTSTELLSRMDWLNDDSVIQELVYDRPMNLFAFVAIDGYAYAVQRIQASSREADNPKNLFGGHCFHSPHKYDDFATKAAINSRFSLIALGSTDGSIWLYNVRDYTGGIALLRRVQPPASSGLCGAPTVLSYSPDGYCLFAGYSSGWVTYSVYGQLLSSTFTHLPTSIRQGIEEWLLGVQDAAWVGGGSELVLLEQTLGKLWKLEFARSAATGCFTVANVSKALLQTSTGFMVYRGHQVSDVLTTTADVSLWQHVKVPNTYTSDNWPLRAAVVSPDGRYLAIAGQRGLAHYSFASSRWKVFNDLVEQNSFFVRGGMCWHHHILIAAVEVNGAHELRVHSREAPLSLSGILHTQILDAPAVHVSPSGDDSILVYTYDNILNHFVISASRKTVELIKVGQIALNGIIRAPPRVRGVSWVVPTAQLQNGESARDVAVASVFFLVDGKLVLLQPSTSEDGSLKYDMRVVAQHVEYYMLARDASLSDFWNNSDISAPPVGVEDGLDLGHSLEDSLWIFDGAEVKVWPNVIDLLSAASIDANKELHAPVTIAADFYPLSTLLQRGILFGVEAELIQRRDGNFSFFHTVARTTLYLPQLLQHYLEDMNLPAALRVSRQYQGLPYFAHALEVLLHNVLDEEVEHPREAEDALLPVVLSFLSTFPEYLDIIVQCARKTELRSWRTLFAYLPPPIELFEISLEKGALKTAGGYLLVLHNLEDVASTSPQVLRLLRSAKAAQDWDLCKELARFLVALDESGDTLKEALDLVDTVTPSGAGLDPQGLRTINSINSLLSLTNGTSAS